MTLTDTPAGARTDKWQLAAGGTVYAPEHPLYLHVPGFWDEVQIGDRAYRKLLCVSFVLDSRSGTGALARGNSIDGETVPSSATGEGSRATNQVIELFPYLSYWYWYPDRIEARYYLVVREGIGYKQQAGVRVFMDETRRILPDGSLQCEISFDLLKQHPSHIEVVAWGLNAQLTIPEGQAATSTGRVPAPGVVVPKLVETPLFEMLNSGGLANTAPPSTDNFLNAVHWRVAFDENAPVKLFANCTPSVT